MAKKTEEQEKLDNEIREILQESYSTGGRFGLYPIELTKVINKRRSKNNEPEVEPRKVRATLHNLSKRGKGENRYIVKTPSNTYKYQLPNAIIPNDGPVTAAHKQAISEQYADTCPQCGMFEYDKDKDIHRCKLHGWITHEAKAVELDHCPAFTKSKNLLIAQDNWDRHLIREAQRGPPGNPPGTDHILNKEIYVKSFKRRVPESPSVLKK